MADRRDEDEPSGAAIARVLAVERAARTAVERARADVHGIDEAARADVRRLGERTEQRIRRVVDAFERATARRLREIEAEAAGLEDAQPIDAGERDRLQRAVAELARHLVGAKP
jgi:transcription initiation factor TFIIIB Brf1 subunit/transcription initiation factor TFIIB